MLRLNILILQKIKVNAVTNLKVKSTECKTATPNVSLSVKKKIWEKTKFKFTFYLLHLFKSTNGRLRRLQKSETEHLKDLTKIFKRIITT